MGTKVCIDPRNCSCVLVRTEVLLVYFALNYYLFYVERENEVIVKYILKCYLNDISLKLLFFG